MYNSLFNHCSLSLTLLIFSNVCFAQSFTDSTFEQAVSVKYQMPGAMPDLALHKLATDYNGIPYMLTDSGVYRTYNDQLLPDGFYLSLADKMPIDITIQDSTGYLFYLYENHYLSNAHAGTLGSNLPRRYEQIRVNAGYEVMIFDQWEAAIYRDNQWQYDLPLPQQVLEIYPNQGSWFALTSTTLCRLTNQNWQPLYQGNDLQSAAFTDDQIWLGTSQGLISLDHQGQVITPLDTALPVTNITKLAWHQGTLWAITPRGAWSRDSSGYRYYASRRWLDQDSLIDLGFGPEGDIYLLSASGLNQIDFTPMTLEKKAHYFETKIRREHLRYGFVSALNHSREDGNVKPYVHDHDNDGLWTSFYLSSQALRYATTGDARARRYAWESFEAFERLLSVNPLEGFPARTFERSGYKVSDPDRWRSNATDAGWEWKGTTSSDEFVAYMLVAAMMHEFVAENDIEKQRVSNFIDAILTHILDNNYYFVDDDGQPTTWGRWHPDFVNGYAPTIYDRKLNSTLLIAGLQQGYALTGKSRYRDDLTKVMHAFGYLENMMRPMADMRPTPHQYGPYSMGLEWNHSDDEMAFLTYWVLHRYALNDDLRDKIEWVIRDHWAIEQPERNALWNLIAFATSGDLDLASTIWHLREFPLDLRNYPVTNSHRQDLTYLEPNFREQTTVRLLPPGEQPMHRHNSNPFRLDGGNGHQELAGDEYLFPYWLGRYLGVITPAR